MAVTLQDEFYGLGAERRNRVLYGFRVVDASGNTVADDSPNRRGVVIKDNGKHKGEVVACAGPEDSVDKAVAEFVKLGVPRLV